MKKIIGPLTVLVISCHCMAQQQSDHQADSILIDKVEDSLEPDKVLHAEPLFIDLIRDLGARKGEKEWNYGMGITDFKSFDEYEFLVEYEFALLDRLGIEFEVPLLFYRGQNEAMQPENTIESLKIAGQWTFLVDQDKSTSLALGYINEILFHSFNSIGEKGLVEGNLFNPFFVGAKRWGSHMHTLIYTGPRFEYHYSPSDWSFEYEMHLNFHYMVPGTGNFVGMEINQYFNADYYNITLRPQARVDINENILIGIVTGIPLNNRDEGLSFFIRLIYEPEFFH
jgi:hypothetical protein